jgi:hypothetical protein
VSYFIQFADGSQQWSELPDELDDLLEKTVDVLAIGGDDEDWTLPPKLSKLLNGRNGTRRGNTGVAGVANTSLGHIANGDYVVKFTISSIRSLCGKPRYSKQFNRFEKKVGVKDVELSLMMTLQG